MCHGAHQAAFVIGFLIPAALVGQDEWARADSAVRRLDPGAFPGRPDAGAGALKRRGCTVPQTFLTAEPDNVVAGDVHGEARAA